MAVLENTNYMLEFVPGMLWSGMVPLAIQKEVVAVLVMKNYMWRIMLPNENKNKKTHHDQQRKAGMDILIHTEGKCSAFLSPSGEKLFTSGS